MPMGRLGRRVARAGRQAARTAAPGIAAALGTLAISNPGNAATAIDTNTPSTASPVTAPTGEIVIPPFSGNQFHAFEIPADAPYLEIDVLLSGNDPDLNAYLLLTAGDQLDREVAVPLITVQPGSSTISGSTTIAQAGGAVTLSGGGGGVATLTGSSGTSTLTGGPDLSFADLFIYQFDRNFSVAGGGASTISDGGGNSTILAGGGNATFLASGGNSTVFAGGGNSTIFAGGEIAPSSTAGEITPSLAAAEVRPFRPAARTPLSSPVGELPLPSMDHPRKSRPLF